MGMALMACVFSRAGHMLIIHREHQNRYSEELMDLTLLKSRLEKRVSGMWLEHEVCEARRARAGERTRVCGEHGANEPGYVL